MDDRDVELEKQVQSLLEQGRKIEAVKLYKDTTGVALIEAKQAVESLAARPGLATPRTGCFGVLMVGVVTALALGTTLC